MYIMTNCSLWVKFVIGGTISYVIIRPKLNFICIIVGLMETNGTNMFWNDTLYFKVFSYHKIICKCQHVSSYFQMKKLNCNWLCIGGEKQTAVDAFKAVIAMKTLSSHCWVQLFFKK